MDISQRQTAASAGAIARCLCTTQTDLGKLIVLFCSVFKDQKPKKWLSASQRRTLERQEATGDILAAVSSLTAELQLILDTLVRMASWRCRAENALIYQQGGLDISLPVIEPATRQPLLFPIYLL